MVGSSRPTNTRRNRRSASPGCFDRVALSPQHPVEVIDRSLYMLVGSHFESASCATMARRKNPSAPRARGHGDRLRSTRGHCPVRAIPCRTASLLPVPSGRPAAPVFSTHLQRQRAHREHIDGVWGIRARHRGDRRAVLNPGRCSVWGALRHAGTDPTRVLVIEILVGNRTGGTGLRLADLRPR